MAYWGNNTAVDLESMDEPVYVCVPCDGSTTSWKEYLEHKNVHRHEIITRCILKNDPFCSCCLAVGDRLVSMSQEVTFASSSSPQRTLESILCDVLNIPVLKRFNPLLVCEKCIEKILIAHNFKTTFDESTRVIQNCLMHLEQCLNGITKVGRLPAIGDAVTIQIHFDSKKLNRTKESFIKKESIHQSNVGTASNYTQESKVLPHRAPQQKFIPSQKRNYQRKYSVMHECTQCLRDFTTNSSLTEHRMSHDKNDKYVCRICKSTFTLLKNMEEHKLTHGFADVVLCYICRQDFPRQELSEHLYKAHKDKQLTCDYCSKTAFLKSAMAKHILNKHLSPPHDDGPSCKQCFLRILSSREHKCQYKCLDCTEYPCIHQKYLIAYRDEDMERPKTQHKCLDCDFVYFTRPKLIEHVNKDHLSFYPYQCTQCDERFTSKHNLRSHRVHLTFTCPHCSNTFTSKVYLNRHTVECVNLLKPYQCDVCEGKFETNEKLDRHKKSHIRTKRLQQTAHNCDICGLTFESGRKYTLHRREHSTRKKNGSATKSTGPEKIYKCDVCDKSFEIENKLVQHTRMHIPKKFQCNSCQWGYRSQEELDEHMAKRHNNIKNMIVQKIALWCSMCMLEFPTAGERIEHEIQHPVDTRHVCRFCSETFETKQERYDHLRGHALKLDQKCEICGRMYDKYTIDRHMRTHIPKKRTDKQADNAEVVDGEGLVHMCDVCGVLMNTKLQLQTHKYSHREKEKCTHCFKSISRGQYAAHLKLHEAKDEKCLKVYINKYGKTRKVYMKKLECKQCDYSTLYEPCFEAHMNRQHYKIRPYKCSQCSGAYYSKIHYKLHVKTHMNLKPEQCEECGLRFTCKKNLTYHMRRHTGERPYTCDVCDAGFINLNRMNMHKKRKHAEPTLPCPVCAKMFFERSTVNKHVQEVHYGKKRVRDRRKGVVAGGALSKTAATRVRRNVTVKNEVRE